MSFKQYKKGSSRPSTVRVIAGGIQLGLSKAAVEILRRQHGEVVDFVTLHADTTAGMFGIAPCTKGDLDAHKVHVKKGYTVVPATAFIRSFQISGGISFDAKWNDGEELLVFGPGTSRQ